MGDLLLALQVVRSVLLDAAEAASHELVLVDDMVGLGSKHRLDVVVAVAHDQAIAVTALGRGRHLLDLQALHDGDWEHLLGLVGVVEDDTARELSVEPRDKGAW